MKLQSLGREDPLNEEMATHCSILPGESHGQRSLMGYSPWGCRVGHHLTTEHVRAHTHTHAHTQVYKNWSGEGFLSSTFVNYKRACQGHLASASIETEPCAAAAIDLQHPLKQVQGGE